MDVILIDAGINVNNVLVKGPDYVLPYFKRMIYLEVSFYTF